MSSGSKPRSLVTTHNDAQARPDSKLTLAVSIDEHSSRVTSNSSMEDTLAAGGEGKKSMAPDPAHPTDPLGHDSPDAGSVASEGGANKTRTSSRSRRSRNGGEKQNEGMLYKEPDSSARSSEVEEERSTFIDALASTLARLDEEAYKKAVLRDANAMLENLILPMSFPWAHLVGPVVRTIPRDIDEMPAIQMIDDAEHELCSLKHNNFDLARRESSDSEDIDALTDDKEDFRAVARRADDPGVVELLTCAKPLISAGNDASLTRVAEKSSILLKDPVVETAPGHGGLSMVEPRDMGVKTPGEVLYRVFEQVQDSKRRKLEAGMARLKTSMISFKVGSTSSRPRLFNRSYSQTRLPLLLPAELPQDFRPLAKSRNKDRIPPGRSKLVWMEKVSSRTSHRVSFKSYLTNEKVEAGLQKRPRDVLVGIRVNGKLLSSPNITSEDIVQAQAGGSSKRKRDGKSASVYSTKYVNEALDEACVGVGTEPRLGTRQCSMDTEVYTKRILASEVNRDKSMGWNSKTSIKSLNVIYVTPRIDCFPTEDGLLHVLCTSPGELQPTNVDEVLNGASRKTPTRECTVCWRDISISGENVSECSECGIFVHRKCCQSEEAIQIPRWKCNICSLLGGSSATPKNTQQETSGTSPPNERIARRSSRVKDGGSPSQGKNTSCCLCPHKGGSMSTLKRGGQTIWAHDVCRIWCDQVSEIGKKENGATRDPRAGGDRDGLFCALCGTSTPTGDTGACNGIVKCAASGCSINFHPMCALFLSKCEDVRMEDPENPKGSNGKDSTKSSLGDPRLEKLLDEDAYLCRQYSLRFAKCSVPGGTSGAPQPSSSSVLPVCFCGIHNPNRDRSLYGLYPGGKYIDEQVMRVPPKKAES